MAITKEALDELIEPKGDIEKVSSVGFDGRALLTRIPKDLAEELGIKKGDKLTWVKNTKDSHDSLTLSGANIIKL